MEAALGEGQTTAPQQTELPLTSALDVSVNSLEDAIARVMKEALAVDGVKSGLNQVAKSIESGRAHVVFLAKNVEEPKIAEAITLLAARKKIPVVMVPDSKELGRWAGLCKIDREGQARKIVGASCASIVEWGADSSAFTYLDKHIKSTA